MFWGCVLGGYVPCPVPSGAGDLLVRAALLRHLDTLLGYPLVVTTAADLDEVRRVGGTAAVAVETLLGGAPAGSAPAGGAVAGADTGPVPAAVAPEDVGCWSSPPVRPALPRRSMLTHANLLASMAAKTAIQRDHRRDVVLNWISFDHVAALLECHLLPLAAGAGQLQVTAAVVSANRLEFLRPARRARVTMTFTPNFLLGLINAALATTGCRVKLDLPRRASIVSGGEAIVPRHRRRLPRGAAPVRTAADALWPAFGMTETCAGSIYNHEFPPPTTARSSPSLGRPVRGAAHPGRRRRDAPLAEGEVGELQLNGPMVTRATCTTRRPPRPRSPPTAGSAPATSAESTAAG